MSNDLWGAMPPADTNPTAVSVLKDQGDLLSEKTNGVLLGSVVRRTTKIRDRDVLNFDFYIICPTQNHYRYEVLSLKQLNFPEAFPVEVVWDNEKSQEDKIVETMDEFKGVVRDILQSERVQRVILNLLREEE